MVVVVVVVVVVVAVGVGVGVVIAGLRRGGDSQCHPLFAINLKGLLHAPELVLRGEKKAIDSLELI